MGTLRDRMLVDLQLSGAKPSTQRAYLREAENLAKHFHKSPEQPQRGETPIGKGAGGGRSACSTEDSGPEKPGNRAEEKTLMTRPVEGRESSVASLDCGKTQTRGRE